uniref:RRM domain-containing protein n=1 Tax=Oryza glumipatula TaxID=40148 RepID=A0A0D9YYE0_9ORYZ
MAAASSSTSSAAGSAAPAHAPAAGGAGGGGSSGVPNHRTRFGDTTLTKVFVGGLAWETPSKGLQDHFQQYGEILEAVVITDRETSRSKGYGFVTFREPESAREAVRNPNPTIGGRRANCNIASMGPPRPSPSRGRAPRGSHFPDQPHMGPQPYMGGRLPPQHMTAPPQQMYYHPQFGMPCTIHKRYSITTLSCMVQHPLQHRRTSLWGTCRVPWVQGLASLRCSNKLHGHLSFSSLRRSSMGALSLQDLLSHRISDSSCPLMHSQGNQMKQPVLNQLRQSPRVQLQLQPQTARKHQRLIDDHDGASYYDR